MNIKSSAAFVDGMYIVGLAAIVNGCWSYTKQTI